MRISEPGWHLPPASGEGRWVARPVLEVCTWARDFQLKPSIIADLRPSEVVSRKACLLLGPPHFGEGSREPLRNFRTSGPQDLSQGVSAGIGEHNNSQGVLRSVTVSCCKAKGTVGN